MQGGVRSPQRRLLLDLLNFALAAVDGRRCTREALSLSTQTRLRTGPVWAVAVGKAAASMALGASDALGPRLERLLLITKDGHVGAEVRQLAGIEVRESAHPLPDARSLEAGARLLRFIDEIPRTARPLFLVSGGASSLVEVLTPGVELADLQRLNAAGLASGLTIEALNARRQQVSLLKGGRLSARLHGRGAIALFISDVPGDDPAVIGSGLLGPAASGSAAADDIERVVIASIDRAREAVRERAADAVCAARVGRLEVHCPPERFSGDAGALAARMAHAIARGPAALHIWGGESVIELPERPGRGGRNQHLALAAARHLAGRDDLFLLAVGTDGTDGPTADAGALVDGATCARITRAGLDVDECLRRADSGAALDAAGDLVHTGPTGTNVGDLVLGLSLDEGAARVWACDS